MTENLEMIPILAEAGLAAGLDADGARLIRHGENAIYRLSSGVIARISQPGQQVAARREVAVSRWLNDSGVAAVAALGGIAQPVHVDDRAVTFWEELAPHQQGTPTQIARVLKMLHNLSVPEQVPIGSLDPFVRLEQRIRAAAISEDDRIWLAEQLASLRDRWAALAPDLSTCVVHGDAWAGNVVATEDGRVVLLDLERCSVGPPEWDLVSTAAKYTSYGGVSRREYDDFTAAYGRDVIMWEHFDVMRDIRELRVTCYAAQQAAAHARFQREAALRIGCLRGKHGTRPWKWTAVE